MKYHFDPRTPGLQHCLSTLEHSLSYERRIMSTLPFFCLQIRRKLPMMVALRHVPRRRWAQVGHHIGSRAARCALVISQDLATRSTSPLDGCGLGFWAPKRCASPAETAVAFLLTGAWALFADGIGVSQVWLAMPYACTAGKCHASAYAAAAHPRVDFGKACVVCQSFTSKARLPKRPSQPFGFELLLPVLTNLCERRSSSQHQDGPSKANMLPNKPHSDWYSSEKASMSAKAHQ